MTDEDTWTYTVHVPSLATGLVLGLVFVFALNALVTAGPYLDAECTVQDGEVVEASFTNAHEHVSVEEMEQICRDRTDAVHPFVYDIRLALFGPDYTDYDPNETYFPPL